MNQWKYQAIEVEDFAQALTTFQIQDTYLNEGIQTYTEFLNSFADALEAKNKKG